MQTIHATNVQSRSPQEDLIITSGSGTVETTTVGVTMTTGSPVWADFNLEIGALTNDLEFTLDFTTSEAEGVLTVFVDGALIGMFYEEFALDGPYDSGRLFFEEPLAEGTHPTGGDKGIGDLFSFKVTTVGLNQRSCLSRPIVIIRSPCGCIIALT